MVRNKCTDIEDSKRAEAELRRSERILAEGEAISDTGNWSWNIVTGKMTWSAHNCRMLGLDANKVAASLELFLERLHPDDVGPVSQIIEKETAKRCPLLVRISRPNA